MTELDPPTRNETAKPAYAEVVVTLPVEGRFHYQIPEHLMGALEIGHRVLVPFGRRRATGFVVGLTDTVPSDVTQKIRRISERMDVEPLVTSDLLDAVAFTADYYLKTVGEVLKVALPPGLTAASVTTYAATKKGRQLLADDDDLLPDGQKMSKVHKRILEQAAKGAGVRASKAATKAGALLETLGLIAKKERLGASEGRGEVEVVERIMAPILAEPFLTRAPSRRRLYEALEAGPVELEALRAQLGPTSARNALKRMEADGLVKRRRIARKAAPAEVAGIQRPAPSEHELTREQAVVLEAIFAALEAKKPTTFLLNGVTGSGKTEVYLRAIEKARARGDGAIVLVPEIALTPQLEERFRARFGDDVEVLHSAIPDGERRRRWRSLRTGQSNIALGARSALWAPVQRLGIVVVDEEHDSSFKQSSDVRYNGRDLALVRARQTGSVTILGSATPSLESLNSSRAGRSEEVRLTERVENRPMPTIEVVDLVEEKRAMRGDVHLLSRLLQDRLRETVERKGQAILFLNRRGFNTIVCCEDCGDARKCTHCDATLTHHRPASTLACHYCGHTEYLEAPCRKCKSRAMQLFGAGTQRVVEAVTEIISGVRVLRLDRDVTARAGALEETLASFRQRQADVLVGTQMVAKGHDFPGVTLVGVLLADASLAFPDFRAAERTFQLLTQVSGRAGRAEDPGRVVIQTFQPDHYALTCAIEHDVDRFFELEAGTRKEAGYPPFTRVGLIRIESKDEPLADRTARNVANWAKRAGRESEIRVRGPAPAPIPRLRDRYRRMVMVFAPSPAKLVSVLSRVKKDADASPRRVDVIFDVDPVDLL